jgi:hypothetical protein
MKAKDLKKLDYTKSFKKEKTCRKKGGEKVDLKGMRNPDKVRKKGQEARANKPKPTQKKRLTLDDLPTVGVKSNLTNAGGKLKWEVKASGDHVAKFNGLKIHVFKGRDSIALMLRDSKEVLEHHQFGWGDRKEIDLSIEKIVDEYSEHSASKLTSKRPESEKRQEYSSSSESSSSSSESSKSEVYSPSALSIDAGTGEMCIYPVVNSCSISGDSISCTLGNTCTNGPLNIYGQDVIKPESIETTFIRQSRMKDADLDMVREYYKGKHFSGDQI